MVDVKLSGKPLDQRISDRLRSSGEGTNPDVHVVKGSGPTRTHTHIHHSRVKQTGDGGPPAPKSKGWDEPA